MGEYIPNKIRCRNCKWFTFIQGEKIFGTCKFHKAITTANLQIPDCFTKK